MQLTGHRAVVAAAAMLCIVGLGACDSGEDSSVMEVDGRWTSEPFQNRDLGQAVLDVTFDQDGDVVEGTGVLRLVQAGTELPFSIDGTVRSQSVQFQLNYGTAVPENVTCTRNTDIRLKCTKGTDRFNLDRNEV